MRETNSPSLARLHFFLLAPENVEALTICHQGSVVAGVLSFYFRNEVIPYYGGGSAAARGLRANDYLYWELMRRATSLGCTSFDFGRSKRGTGAYRFKTHWGFESEVLSYEYYLVNASSMPNLSPTNPKYSAMIRLWSKLPVSVSRLIGPPIAKYLG
ncbi:MAG: GNAT family N-acetyltransferase [Pseudomonadota bacterium]